MDKWDTQPDYEIFNGPHQPEPNHQCMVEGIHVHAVGRYRSFFRVALEGMDSTQEQPGSFHGMDCPVCQLFGNDEDSVQLRDIGEDFYECDGLRPHIMHHNDLVNWWAKKTKDYKEPEEEGKVEAPRFFCWQAADGTGCVDPNHWDIKKEEFVKLLANRLAQNLTSLAAEMIWEVCDSK